MPFLTLAASIWEHAWVRTGRDTAREIVREKIIVSLLLLAEKMGKKRREDEITHGLAVSVLHLLAQCNTAELPAWHALCIAAHWQLHSRIIGSA